MVNQIDELKKENHRLKENDKKIGLIFIKSQKLNFKISKYADEENIFNACEGGDVEKFVSLFEIKFIEDFLFSKVISTVKTLMLLFMHEKKLKKQIFQITLKELYQVLLTNV